MAISEDGRLLPSLAPGFKCLMRWLLSFSGQGDNRYWSGGGGAGGAGGSEGEEKQEDQKEKEEKKEQEEDDAAKRPPDSQAANNCQKDWTNVILEYCNRLR